MLYEVITGPVEAPHGTGPQADAQHHAHQFTHLHHSKWRLLLMERNYFGEALCPGTAAEHYDWRRLLALDLRQPHYTIPWTLV